jgi:hypothetical protein
MNRNRFLLAVVIGVLVLGSVNVWGQVTASASLRGTVEDKTHAVIKNANVALTSKETGVARSTQTNDAGEYRFELLGAGTYNVKITASGFGPAEAKNVEVLVGTTTTQNFTLTPGTVSETIEVSGTAPLVDQQKTDVSLAITPQQIEELPLNGRDFGSLAYLAPGVKQVDSYDPTKNRYSIFGVNGSSGRNVNLTVNGIDNKDNTVGGPVMQLPLEAIEEFKISTQRFSAANGRSEGAAIDVVTKSGSNKWHGSAFGQFRDTSLNANDFFSKQKGTATPPYSRQIFGGSVGGPLKSDKLFVFFAIERQREHTSLPEGSQAFSELSLIVNNADLKAGLLGTPQPAAVIPTPYFDTRYGGRMDYNFSPNHHIYLAYHSQSNNGQNDQSTGTSDLTAGNFTTNQLQIANLTLSSNLTSNLVNQATVGWQYWNNLISTNSFTPTITFNNTAFSYGTNTNVPQQSVQRKWQFKDDVSWVHGRHSFKTGFDYVWEPFLGGYFEFNPTLEIDFTGKPSDILAGGGFTQAGLVSGMSATAGNPRFVIATKMFGLYFQDTWKVNNRLTLDLGVRWDKDFNMIGGTSVTANRTYQALKGINSPFTSSLPQDDNMDFSPRVGFAYDLTGSGRHLLRGGYGLYYGQVFENIPLFMIQQANSTIFQTTFAITGSKIVPGTGIPLNLWHVGNPLPVLPGPSSALNPGSVGRLMDPHYRNPYAETWNLGYTWVVTPQAVVELEYVHELALHESKTINIDQGFEGTPPPLDALIQTGGQPVFSRVDDEQSIGRSRYDGLNFSYRQRVWKHFTMDAYFTLSRALAYDGNAAAFRNRPTIAAQPFRKADYGPVPNDEARHLSVDAVVDLPFGLRVAPIVQVGSARPYNDIMGYDLYQVGAGRGNATIVVNNSTPSVLNSFKGSANRAAAQACLAAGNCHELGFDAFRGAAFFELDTRISRVFKFKERSRLEIMTQLYNLTNRANFGNNFDGNLGDFSTTFQQPIGYINPSSTTIPRAFSAEFGARFTF